ncbi:MAG: hypothetical protein ABSE16_15760 [Verrucomicrobiota bacterium]
MKTVTVDDYNRVRIPDAKPRQKFSYESLGDGRVIRLALLKEREVPLVKARKFNDRWMGAKGLKPDRRAIVNSIREDRER